jgi:hypothetical protein
MLRERLNIRHTRARSLQPTTQLHILPTNSNTTASLSDINGSSLHCLHYIDDFGNNQARITFHPLAAALRFVMPRRLQSSTKLTHIY